MSDYLKPTLYNGKGLENQLRNCMYNIHDLSCGCDRPRQHLISLLTNKPCHLSTATHGDSADGKEEFETELWVSKLTKRRPNYYVYDKPHYDYVPPTPLVNFDLNYH